MELESILQYARERGLSPQDASQTFMQIVVLRNLNLPQARLVGGTALVLGHGNPRFSEDVDLTQISDPILLEQGLRKATSELEGWFGKEVTLLPPKTGGRTWRLTCRLGRADSLRLHIDSQEYPAYTTHPIVIQFPSLPSFVCEAISLDEILAEKVIALAFRNYLGGRDLFDLWFHWLRGEISGERLTPIRDFVARKLVDRALTRNDFLERLKTRLAPGIPLKRVREEWERYLPRDFQTEAVQRDIFGSLETLPRIFQ